MPPRVSVQSLQACCSETSLSWSSRAWQASQFSVSTPVPSLSRPFSATTSRPRRTSGRMKIFMEAWMKNEGKDLKKHTPGRPNYLTLNYNDRSREGSSDRSNDRPFPTNPAFRSQKVLSEEARELIWEKFFKHGEGVKSISAEFGVDQRRVVAVIRMKEVEKEWIAQGKKLATPYSKAVLEMVPVWHVKTDGSPNVAFEPINEIHVHGYTMQQLFVPTSESKHFTREDAAKAFHRRMLSPDKRVPHPELVQMERDILNGMSPADSYEKFRASAMASEVAHTAKNVAIAAREEKKITSVQTDRYEFRFKDINCDVVGAGGRSRKAVGWRYGMPFEDRKKDQVKIPTKVD